MKTIYWLLILVASCLNGVAYAAKFDATIDFSPRIELSIPVSGIVDKVNVSTGQRVVKGEEILALDPAPFLTAKKHAQSRHNLQQISLTESLRDLGHQQELYDRTVLATVELENAKLRVKRDKALLQNTEAQLDEAEYALSHSKLNAPFDALILAIHVNQGQFISNALQSKNLISLVRQGHYQARFYVTSDELDKFSIGNKVVINTGEDQYQGTISTITYEPMKLESGGNESYMIEAGFISKKQHLPVGQKASVQID